MLKTKDLKILFEEYNYDFRSFSREEQKEFYKRCLMHNEYYYLRCKLVFSLEKEDYKEIFSEFHVFLKMYYSYRNLLYRTNPMFLEVILETDEMEIDTEELIRGFKHLGFNEKFLDYYEQYKLIPSADEYRALSPKHKMIYKMLMQSKFNKAIIYGNRNSFWKLCINMINIYGVEGYEEAYRLALKSIDYSTFVNTFTYMYIFPIVIIDKERAKQFIKLYIERLGTMRNTKNAVRHFFSYHNNDLIYRAYKIDIIEEIREGAKTSKKIRKALKEIGE